MTDKKPFQRGCKVVLSCDPGISSYICMLDVGTSAVRFIANSTAPYILYSELQEVKEKFNIIGVGLEDVHAIFGTSAGSNFKFGYNYGVVSALLATLGISIYLVKPKEWQKYIGVVKTKSKTPLIRRNNIKKQVGDICNRLYPKANIHGVRGGLIHDKSDACMIAHTVLHKFKLK